MSETTPATPPPPPATPTPRSPIDSFEALFRELVVAFSTMQSNAASIPLPPGAPSSLPVSSSDVALASLVPMNQKQLEILQASDTERKARVLKDERDRDWRRMIILGLSAVVLGLEVFRAVSTPATIQVSPAPAIQVAPPIIVAPPAPATSTPR